MSKPPRKSRLGAERKVALTDLTCSECGSYCEAGSYAIIGFEVAGLWLLFWYCEHRKPLPSEPDLVLGSHTCAHDWLERHPECTEQMEAMERKGPHGNRSAENLLQ